MKISVIVPIYNSENTIQVIDSDIHCYFSTKKYDYEIVYVNDKSLDNSKNILNNLTNNNIKIIHLGKNCGQQNAIFCGMHFVEGDYVLTMDDDLQHNINDLDKLLEEVNKGYDLVYGVYQNDTNSFFREVGSKITSIFFKKNFNLGNNRVSSFRIFSSSLLRKALKCPYKFIYLSAILLKEEPRVSNISIIRRKRLHGKSGYNLRKLILLFMKLNFYYSKVSFEFMKPKSKAFVIESMKGIKEELIYEKNNDVRCWELSVKCN